MFEHDCFTGIILDRNRSSVYHLNNASFQNPFLCKVNCLQNIFQMPIRICPCLETSQDIYSHDVIISSKCFCNDPIGKCSDCLFQGAKNTCCRVSRALQPVSVNTRSVHGYAKKVGEQVCTYFLDFLRVADHSVIKSF